MVDAHGRSLGLRRYVLLELLREVVRTSTLLVVLHNQKHARAWPTAHGAAGRRAGEGGAWHGSSVFTHVRSRPVRSLCVRTAAPYPRLTLTRPCWPRRGAAADLGHLPACVLTAPSGTSAGASGPRKVTGLKPGSAAAASPLVRLALWLSQYCRHLPGPNDMDHDLAALKRVGISHLITLLTERDLPQDAKSANGHGQSDLPIQDTKPQPGANPDVAQAHGNADGAGRGTGRPLHGGARGNGAGHLVDVRRLTAEEGLRRDAAGRALRTNAEQEAFLQRYRDVILQRFVR